MRRQLLRLLVCPDCGTEFRDMPGADTGNGTLQCANSHEFPIRDSVPRFVDDEGYAGSFGFEWTRHSDVQLDSVNRDGYSEDALRKKIDLDLESLKGLTVLDAGCGSGRYAEVFSRFGATVVGVDRTRAIDMAMRNLGDRDNVHLLQGDLFALPLKPASFDIVYSFGVLHHTPDTREAFSRLVPLVKPGGLIYVALYSSYNKALVRSSDFWRRITTRMPDRVLHALCYVAVPLYYFYRIPVLGELAKAALVISMDPSWRRRVLDTFDWYSPRYQWKHTHFEVAQWFQSHGLRDIRIFEEEVTMGARVPGGSSAIPESARPDESGN